jgi:hypothetical protein
VTYLYESGVPPWQLRILDCHPIMNRRIFMKRYDIPTAVTFLFAGLGLGAVLAVLFAPRAQQRSIEGERIDDVRIFDEDMQAQDQDMERDEEAYASRAV